jgi:hypothetical protein
MLALTGGERAFGREGFHQEEETNWRRGGLAVVARLVPPRHEPYQLGPDSPVSSEDFNRGALVLPTDEEALRTFTEGMEVTGDLQLPLLTLHTTGDGQVPIGQAQLLRRRVDEAGAADRLAQRVIEDPGHCGFTTEEQEVALADLVEWVEDGVEPDATNLAVDDLSDLDRTFELLPRAGTPGAARVPGARERVTVRGQARLDGRLLEARFLGAVVRRDGLVTPCQQTLPAVERGRYELVVLAEEEGSGCGRPGAEILLWTFVGDERLFSTEAIRWPSASGARRDVVFSAAAPLGASLATTDYSGEIYRRDGRRVAPGTRVEARVDGTVCGVASTRRTGSFAGYVLSVVGEAAVPGCRSGARVTFRIDGDPAVETVVNGREHGGALDLTVR